MAEAIFAKAGRGYDREQVDAFLLELNRSFSEKEAELKEQIRQLTASLTETQAALAESEKRASALEVTYEGRLQEKERECALLQASIGQRMIAADTRAEEIVSSAQEQADALLADARRRAEHEAELVVAETRQKCAVIGRAAAEFSDRMHTVSSELCKTEALLDEAMEEIKQKAIGRLV